MDFGRGKTGRPPSPMWFRAYGNYAFYRVPVLMEKADWTWPAGDIDYVWVPEPGRDEYQSQIIQTTRPARGHYTWVPTKFTARISLIVQHSPSYWTNWSLDDYRSGAMLKHYNSFHQTGVSATATSGASGSSAGNILNEIFGHPGSVGGGTAITTPTTAGTPIPTPH